MTEQFIILNEKDLRGAKSRIAEIEYALSSEEQFNSIVEGLSLDLVNGYRRAMQTQKQDLEATIQAYEEAKEGDFSDLLKRAGGDIGVFLIIARIIKGYSQKDLARRLGIKEQQIQRYEADRYKSINIANYKRIAHALGVKLDVKMQDVNDWWLSGNQELINKYYAEDIKKVMKHAKEHGWFDAENSDVFDDEIGNPLQRYISDHFLNYGSPALLRTGFNIEDMSDDLLLVAWKARVTEKAAKIISENKVSYNEIDISWLNKLVKLSAYKDGPSKARKLLLEYGIILIAEPQIQGLKLDGAAFLMGNIPVIGLTLRHDRLDNFWFTLLHEVAHIILHYRMGLKIGFFDETEKKQIDEIEQEADNFALNLLIPNEKWKRSPARISKTDKPIEKLAEDLGIHPAIVFGRVRKERDNYTIFSNKLGQGLVRKCLL